MLQPLREFLRHAKGEAGAPTLLHPPLAFGDHSREQRCLAGGDGGEEASHHPNITRAMGTETSAEPQQLERSPADISISYKRKG